jgi:hypothetical protein
MAKLGRHYGKDAANDRRGIGKNATLAQFFAIW